MPEEKTRHKFSLKTTLLLFLSLVALFGIGFYAYHNTDLPDIINNFGYTPETAIANLATDLELTDKGKTIFYASRPALEDSAAFNEHCKSHNEKIAVLGCYTAKKIYIYNSDDTELAGVIESTAAHELLHAAWTRLSSDEKSRLATELNNIYNTYKDALSEDLSIYDDDAQLDELHSRVGTQIPFNNLTKTLQDHYKKYFKNYNRIIEYYDDYIEPFRDLQEEQDTLREQLEDEQDDIDYRSQEYYQSAERLSKLIDEFNRCAETANCFRTDAEFNARRAELVAEQNKLEDEYNSINDAIESYNQKVEAYNKSVLRTQDLENAINSNAKLNERIN